MSSFAEQVADDLLAESSALGARWLARTRVVAPRGPGHDVYAAAAAGSPAIVHALACALRNAPRCQDGVLRAGWEYGAAAHAGGAALHHVVKELDLLAAMALYVAERTAERGANEAGAAEGVRVGRRLHRAFATLRLAASKGYTHAAGEEMRGRYRALRHDLRNPLGTIKSAVSLMEDESLPAEIRYSPRYRAMVARNATSLDAMIGAGLSDAATELAALTSQEVSLRDVALAVRRDMRDEAEGAACVVEVSPALGPPVLPPLFIDSAVFELALRSVVSVALSRARRGTAVAIGLRARRDVSVVVGVGFEGARPEGAARAAPDDAFAFAESLARRAGGRAWREGDATVLLEIPISDPDSREEEDAAALSPGESSVTRGPDRSVEREVGAAVRPVVGDLPSGGGRPERGGGEPPRASRHPGDDLAGARQGDHG